MCIRDRFNVDEKYPQALGISTITQRVSILGNSAWEILHNDIADSPLFTSDYPVALEETGGKSVNWIVPPAPDLAVRIIPDIGLSGAPPDFEFKKFRHRNVKPKRFDIVAINRLIVRSAENMVFYRDDFPWVHHFIGKNRYYRIEAIVDRLPHNTGVINIPRQRIVPFRYGT